MGSLPKHIQHWDDERNLDHGIIVTLQYGWSFENGHHEGVQGFDTVSEARYWTAKKRLYRCYCKDCRSNTLELSETEKEILNHRLEVPDCIAESLNDGKDIFDTYAEEDIYYVCEALQKGDIEEAKDVNTSLWIEILDNAVTCNQFYGMSRDEYEEYEGISKSKWSTIRIATKTLEKKISKLINREVRFPRD